MDKEIKYYIKNNYGTINYYITGKFKETISNLTHKKTVNNRDMIELTKLGFTMVLVAYNGINIV